MTSYPHEATFTALGMQCQIITTRPQDLLAAVDEALEELSRLAAVISFDDRRSEVSRLSRLASFAEVTAPASALLLDYLGAALWAADLTEGLVSPSDGVWRGIELGDGTVKLPRGTILDLSETAPSHAADLLARRLHADSGGGFLVRIGDAVAVAGDSPEGGWEIPVTAPGGRTLQVVSTRFAAVSKAEDDLRADQPHPIWTQVTVAAPTALEARAWAAASQTKGELAPAWLTNHGVTARLERRTGTTRYTAGWPQAHLSAA